MIVVLLVATLLMPLLCATGEQRFVQYFRLTRQAFNGLVQHLRPYLAREQTNMRTPVPVEARVGLTLYYLARGGTFAAVGEVFGVGASTTCIIVHEVCECIVNSMFTEWVSRYWPTGEEKLRRVAAHWVFDTGMPFVIGAIDGSHINIVKPCTGDYAQYSNRKKAYSIVLQAVCDSKFRIIDVNFSKPGSAHDALVFRESSLWARLYVHGALGTSTASLPAPIKGRNGQVSMQTVQVPYVLLGDSAYPLGEHVMRPYPHGTTDAAQRRFNKAMCHARVKIEGTFGRLKGRFLILAGTITSKDLSVVQYIVGACVILHNICEETVGTFCPTSWDLNDLLVDKAQVKRMPPFWTKAMQVLVCELP